MRMIASFATAHFRAKNRIVAIEFDLWRSWRAGMLLEGLICHASRDAWLRIGAVVASRFVRLNVLVFTWLLFTSAAMAIHVPLNSKLTEELDRRLQLAHLLWWYRYGRWHEPLPRYTH